jgi:hypothetical protein
MKRWLPDQNDALRHRLSNPSFRKNQSGGGPPHSKTCGSSLAFEPREASWSAVPLHRFGIGSEVSFMDACPSRSYRTIKQTGRVTSSRK